MTSDYRGNRETRYGSFHRCQRRTDRRLKFESHPHSKPGGKGYLSRYGENGYYRNQLRHAPSNAIQNRKTGQGMRSPSRFLGDALPGWQCLSCCHVPTKYHINYPETREGYTLHPFQSPCDAYRFSCMLLLSAMCCPDGSRKDWFRFP